MSDPTIPKLYISLLVALHDFFEADEHGNGQLLQTQIGKLRNHGVNPGLARAGLDWLREKNLVYQGSEQHEDETWIFWAFTSLGAEIVHQVVDSAERQSSSLEAKLDLLDHDTFTDLRPLEPPVSEVTDNLTTLADYVSSNKKFDLPSEERAVALNELNVLQESLKGGIVRTATLVNAIKQNGVLNFLKEKIPDKTLNALIGVIVTHIAKWLGL